MARGTETKGSQSGATPVQEEASAVGQRPLLTSPLILKRQKSKKSKKKYTRGTKGLQRLLLGVSKAGYRATNSVAEGLNTFAKRSNKSGRKRRAGMGRDLLRNASRGVSDGLNELGKAPGEISRKIGTRRVWRVFRVFTPLTN